MVAATMAEPSPLGLRIIRARKELGWSQATLARQAGVTRGWVSLVEKGDIDDPGEDRLSQLARALRTTTRFLRHGDAEGFALTIEPDELQEYTAFGSLPRPLRRTVLRIAGMFLEETPDTDAGTAGDAAGREDGGNPREEDGG